MRRANLTGRTAIMLVAVCAVALSLAYPARTYLAQREEIAVVRARNAAATSRVAALEVQRRRWNDPAYVQAQARSRLHMVLPGETAYVVVRPKAAAARPAPAVTQRSGAAAPAPWYATVWAGLQAGPEPAAAP